MERGNVLIGFRWWLNATWRAAEEYANEDIKQGYLFFRLLIDKQADVIAMPKINMDDATKDFTMWKQAFISNRQIDIFIHFLWVCPHASIHNDDVAITLNKGSLLFIYALHELQVMVSSWLLLSIHAEGKIQQSLIFKYFRYCWLFQLESIGLAHAQPIFDSHCDVLNE